MSPIVLGIIIITAIISLYGFQNPQFFEKYKFNVSAIRDRKEYIRLLSAGFLHADWIHLGLNMYVFYTFSQPILETFGIFGLLIIYFGAIIFGNLFSLYVYKNKGWYSAIGASGGVSGIIFASVALFPNLIKIGILFLPPQLSLPGYIFGALYFAYSVYMMLNPRPHDNIGHAAHLGGAFFGLVYTVAMFPQIAMNNAFYLGIMSLPLIYLSYEIFIKKRIG